MAGLVQEENSTPMLTTVHLNAVRVPANLLRHQHHSVCRRLLQK